MKWGQRGHAPGADSTLPATLYKFCIILAMNSFLRSKTDSSKGGEGPEAGGGGARCTPNPYLGFWRHGPQGGQLGKRRMLRGGSGAPAAPHTGQVCFPAEAWCPSHAPKVRPRKMQQGQEGCRGAWGSAHVHLQALPSLVVATRPFLRYPEIWGDHYCAESHSHWPGA